MAREKQGTNVPKATIDRVTGAMSYNKDVTYTYGEWMGPLRPLTPIAPEAEGRQFDYPVGYNLNTKPRYGEEVTFEMLRALADGYDLLRLVIETRKDQIESYKWQIVPKEKAANAVKKKAQQDKRKKLLLQQQQQQATAVTPSPGQPSAPDKPFPPSANSAASEKEDQASKLAAAPLEEGTPSANPAAPSPVVPPPGAKPQGLEEPETDPLEDAFGASIEAVEEFFDSPDKEHNWSQWLRMILEDLFVLDAVVMYPRATKGGDLYCVELVDPSTVKRVLDETGRTPLPPETAYQQILKGLPAVDYTRDELLYWMRNPRTNRVYGYGPVEQVIMTVNIALRRQIHQLQFYTEGNVPEALAHVPENWTADQIKQFQLWWDQLMEGNTAARRHMKFIPGMDVTFTKQEALKDMFDEWLARIVCFAFSISPTQLVKETNRATAESVADTAKKEGLMPLLRWVKGVMDAIISRVLGYKDLEFVWDMDEEIEPKSKAEIHKIYLDAGILDENEVREDIGKDPWSDEEIAARQQKKMQAAQQAMAASPFGAPKPPGAAGGSDDSQKKPSQRFGQPPATSTPTPSPKREEDPQAQGSGA
jgi:hypothetical protein